LRVSVIKRAKGNCIIHLVVEVAVTFCTLVGNTQVAAGQGLSDSLKHCIYRTISGTKIGAAICFRDTILKDFLVTCKHVVANDSGKFYDKARFYTSATLPNGSIYSTTRFIEIDLHAGRGGNVVAPSDSIDLVLILIEDRFTNLSEPNLKFSRLAADELLDRNRMATLARPGQQVEVVGFELSLPGLNQYYFSRFGHVSLYPGEFFGLEIDGRKQWADFMFLDLIARKGDSGGPVIAHSDQGSDLIGIISSVSESREFVVAYPIWIITAMRDALIEYRRAQVDSMEAK
jgi:hypothetical protein